MRHRPRLHSLTEDYFRSLSTEDRAYWAGFLLADGTVSIFSIGSASLGLTLGDRDTAHLLAFRAAIGSGHKVTENHTVHGTITRTVRVYSRPMVDDLAQYGMVPRKTYGHPTPKVPAEMLRHFLRGYFDGDGHIGRKGHKSAHSTQYVVSLCATHDFALWMQAAFLANTGIGGQVLAVKGCSNLRLGGNKQVAAWMKWLYADASIALERKRVVAMECARLYGDDAEVAVRSAIAAAVSGALGIEEAAQTVLSIVRREALAANADIDIASRFSRRGHMQSGG